MFDETLKQRFWSKVDRTVEGCWRWVAAKNPAGYGLIRLDRRNHGYLAHRMSWEIANDQRIPAGGVICHHCDNPSCVRPTHLYLGTHKTNYEDSVRRNRRNHHTQGNRTPQKLTDTDVKQIRKRLCKGDTTRAIAKDFGVSQPMIVYIKNGQRRTATSR